MIYRLVFDRVGVSRRPPLSFVTADIPPETLGDVVTAWVRDRSRAQYVEAFLHPDGTGTLLVGLTSGTGGQFTWEEET